MNDYIPQDPYFNKVVHWFLAEKKEIGEEQFLQLRFITAMVRERKCRVEDLPQNRELDKIISGWIKCRLVNEQEVVDIYKNDRIQLRVICEMWKIKLPEKIDYDLVLKLHYLLGVNEKKEDSPIAKDPIFSKIVNHFHGMQEKNKNEIRYNLKQLYQLRFIAFIVKQERYKLENLPEDKSIDDTIKMWQQTGVIDDNEESNSIKRDKKIKKIFEACLGKDKFGKLKKKGKYKFEAGMLIKMNELMNSCSQEWNKDMRKGKFEDIPISIVVKVYNILLDWAHDKKCPLSESDIDECFEKRYYASMSVVARERQRLNREIERYIEPGREYARADGYIRINKIIVEELQRCRKQICERCEKELMKNNGIYLGYVGDECKIANFRDVAHTVKGFEKIEKKNEKTR